MWKGINGDIAGTLDSNYFKGCGEREGLEREIVYWVNDECQKDELSEGDRLFKPRSASRVI